MQDPYAKKNAQMRQTCPELASPYAAYPLTRSTWMKPSETDPAPGFIQGENVGLKPDYVYGPGPFGKGYYHLLTRQSYKTLYGRIANSPPGGCCGSGDRAEMDAWNATRLILFNRAEALKPDDSGKDALQTAQVVAAGSLLYDNINLLDVVPRNLNPSKQKAKNQGEDATV